MEGFKHLTPLKTNYRLITAHWVVDEIQQLERALFVSETFIFNRDFDEFPFRRQFDHHLFLENHQFFREESKYQSLIDFLKAIGSPSFFISAPAYTVLYPLEISVDCPFSVYRNAPSYALEEELYIYKELVRRPLQHPMHGVGFVIMPHVFMYDQTQKWAILLTDSVTEIATIGLDATVKNKFEQAFSAQPILSPSRITETFIWQHLSPEERQKFQSEYNA